jgi:hypothetical protein
MIIDLLKLIQVGLTPDEYVYLYQRAYKVPKEEKEICTRINKELLAEEGWIKITGPTGIYINQKTKDFIEQMHKDMLMSDKTISEEVRRIPEWIKDYIQLWPVKNRKGRMLRGALKDTQKKMEVFIAEYSTENNPITKDLIMKAAKAYLAGQAKEQYMYTKQCNFFIELEGDSVLSDYTDMTDDI